MARRALLRNNIYWLVLLFLVACKEESSNIRVLTNDTLLKKYRGVFYFDDEPFNGHIIAPASNGDTMEVASYQNGVKEGLTMKYWTNGNMKFRAEYKDGIYHGAVEEWYENGQVFNRFTYKDGHENGRQQSWRPDGSLKANYEVKGGRKYGLTGSKNCSNDWAE
ncbi:MAG: toxin-antitoxin system YwqK family antitoxin [Crocinitomicaceae bacterium]